MKTLHIVRRYGPVGGMERYVWETTRELAGLGHEVAVLCERCYAPKPLGVSVYELGEILPKPRWLDLWRFGARVSEWLEQKPHPGFIVHSHERVGVHAFTTFHGPPFAAVRDRPWWRKISFRIAMQLYMERRELSVARFIVPNSILIKKQIAHYYPEYRVKLTSPVVPGVSDLPLRVWHSPAAEAGVIGFVGKEWLRKGLPKAVEIAAKLRMVRPELEFWVVGPQPEEVSHLFANWKGGYKLLGWRDDLEHLAQIDVLLHPARVEPYGMVIAEAMAARARVVVSDACGAAPEVKPDAGTVVSLNAPLEQWVQAVNVNLAMDHPPPEYSHGWRSVAKEYEDLYRLLG